MRCLLVGLVVPLLVLADRTEIDFDPETDFTRFKTFALHGGTIHAAKPELNNDLVRKKVEAAVRARLVAGGLTEAEAKPDLSVVWTLGPAERRKRYSIPARGRGWRKPVTAMRYTEGTLVIDLLDAGTREMVYRATYVADESNASKLSRKLEENAARALESYPPKK